MYQICRFFLGAFLAAQLTTSIASGQTATLKARFVLNGNPPPPRQIHQAGPGGPMPIIDERLEIDPTSKGIKNIVLYVYTARRGTKLERVANKPVERVLTMANGRYEPHILIAQVGDTLKIVDRGPNRHSANLNFFLNQARFLVPQGNIPVQVPLDSAEPVPIPVDCNFHPWMRCYIAILDHPHAAISDSDGRLSIEGLPSDTIVQFRLWHEAAIGAFGELKIDGQAVYPKKNVFTVSLVDGENDLGEILIPVSSLQP